MPAGARATLFLPWNQSETIGAGAHLCAGAWASRALVAGVALPMLFERHANLTLAAAEDVQFCGWAFRGPLSVPVTWNP